jgi:hypothetical protein
MPPHFPDSSQMAVRSAPRAGRPLPPGRFLVLISVRGCVNPRAIVRLEGLGQLINPMTSSGMHLSLHRSITELFGRVCYRSASGGVTGMCINSQMLQSIHESTRSFKGSDNYKYLF